MRAALPGNRPGQPRGHSLRTDEGILAAARQQLAKRLGFRLPGVHAPAQRTDALPPHRAQARIAPGLDRRVREGRCSSVNEIEDPTAARAFLPSRRCRAAPGAIPARRAGPGRHGRLRRRVTMFSI